MEIIFIIGEVIFGLYFIYNGYSHFKHNAGLTGYAKSKGVPMASLSVYLTGAMLLFGGLSLITGYFVIAGLWVLVLFMIPTTIMMHDFWKETDPNARMNQTIGFTKNMAIVGAILMLLGLLS